MQRVVPKGWRRPSMSFVRYYDDDVTVVAPPPSAASPRPPVPRPRKRADSVTTIYAKVPPRSVQVEEITMLAIDVVMEEEPAAVTTRRMIVPPSEPRDVPPSIPYTPRALPQAPIAQKVTATRASMAAMALMFLLTSCAFALAVPRLHWLLTHCSPSGLNRCVAAQTAAK